MKTTINTVTGLRELVVTAILLSISKEIKRTKPTEKHPDGAEYHWCEVEVTYPNGKKAVVDSSLWAKSLASEKLAGAFVVGKEVTLTTQLEGEGAGYSKIGLTPTRKVDISMFSLEDIEEPVPAGDVDDEA